MLGSRAASSTPPPRSGGSVGFGRVERDRDSDSRDEAVDLHLVRVHLRPGRGRPGRRNPARHGVRGHPERLVLPGVRRAQEGLRDLRAVSVEPRQAAALILLRDGADGAEVLLVERNPAQRFMGGAWVFPGGAVHPEDADHAAAAVRELEEEAGIQLPADTELVPFSRWITPEEEGATMRFDAWFYAARAPEGAEARADGGECVDARWLTPAAALEAGARGELQVVFPTIKHLELLAETPSVDATLAAARERTVEPILPKVVTRGGSWAVLLPGEPGYDDA